MIVIELVHMERHTGIIHATGTTATTSTALLVLLVLLVLAPLRRVPIGLVLFQVAATRACASVRKLRVLRVGRHGPGHNTTATTAQLDEQNLLFSTWWWW